MDAKPLEIIHLSDIHGRPELDVSRETQGIAGAVKAAGARPDFLVVSGDLGFQGEHQDRATQFISVLADMLGILRRHIVCCPGNHDIQLNRIEQPFQNYKRALMDIYQGADRVSADAVFKYSTDEAEFFVINSSYHLDHRYGKINIDELRRHAGVKRDPSLRIAIVHHHSIPVTETDRSTIANAYEFLRVLVDLDFDLVLHGHHHIALSLEIGGKLKLAGVGSVNYPPERNLNNQFNILRVGKDLLRFRYMADAMDRGKLGAWEPTGEPW